MPKPSTQPAGKTIDKRQDRDQPTEAPKSKRFEPHIDRAVAYMPRPLAYLGAVVAWLASEHKWVGALLVGGTVAGVDTLAVYWKRRTERKAKEDAN